MITRLKADLRYLIKSDLFYLLMEACYFNADFRAMSAIYELLIRYDVQPDNKIKLMYFELQKEDIKQTQAMERLIEVP